MMEWRTVALFYIIICCICSSVKSRESPSAIQQLTDGLKYDSRRGSESKSVISRNSHRLPPERNILENKISLNILCGQLKGLQKQHNNKDMRKCLCRNTTAHIRNNFRSCKIWRLVHLVGQFIDECARQRTGNYFVWFAGKLVNHSGIQFKRMVIYSTTDTASVQVVKATTHMCNITRPLIFTVVASFPDFSARLLHQKRSQNSGRFRKRCGERWPRGYMDVYKGCLYRHRLRCRVNDSVNTSRTRPSMSNTDSRFRCCRKLVNVIKHLKQWCVLLGWQNSHVQLSLRNDKEGAKYYMVNKRLRLNSRSSQDRKTPSMCTIHWEMDSPLCVHCALILTQATCPHSNLELTSWRQSPAVYCFLMKRLIPKAKVYDDEAIALLAVADGTCVYKKREASSEVRDRTVRNATSVVIKFLQVLTDSALKPYINYANKHEVRKDKTKYLSVMDVTKDSPRGYAPENNSNRSSILQEGDTLSSANLYKDLKIGGQVVGDLGSFKNNGQHNDSNDTLGHSRETNHKLSSVETVHPRPTNPDILNSSITMKGVRTKDSETVFHSFHQYFQHIKMPSSNSFQEQVPRDTHTVNPNGVWVNPQLQEQVPRDTHTVNPNGVWVNPQLQEQVPRDTHTVNPNGVWVNPQLQEQVPRDTHTVNPNGVWVNPQLQEQVPRRPSMDSHFRRRRDIGVMVRDVKPVNMAILLPMSQNRLFCKERVFAAIEIAMKRVEDQDLLPSVKLQARYADSHCSISDAMNAAIEFYAKRTVSMFLGPVCDYAVAPIARQIRYWQLPLVTPGAMAGDFGFRKTPMFPLLTRVGSNFNSLLELLAMLLKQFAWHRMKLIYMPDGFENIMDRYCHIAADAIVLGTRMGATNITVDHKSFHEIRPLLQDMSAEIGTDWGGKYLHVLSAVLSAPVWLLVS